MALGDPLGFHETYQWFSTERVIIKKLQIGNKGTSIYSAWHSDISLWSSQTVRLHLDFIEKLHISISCEHVHKTWNLQSLSQVILLMVQKSGENPPVVYETLWKMGYLLHQLVSRISEPSTVSPHTILAKIWYFARFPWNSRGVPAFPSFKSYLFRGAQFLSHSPVVSAQHAAALAHRNFQWRTVAEWKAATSNAMAWTAWEILGICFPGIIKGTQWCGGVECQWGSLIKQPVFSTECQNMSWPIGSMGHVYFTYMNGSFFMVHVVCR